MNPTKITRLHGHIQKLEIARDEDEKVPEIKKNLKYNVKLLLRNNGEHDLLAVLAQLVKVHVALVNI